MDARENFSLGYQLGSLERRLEGIEKDVAGIKRKIETVETWARRLVLLAVLWSAAIGVNATPELLGEALATAIKSALKK